MKEDFDGWLRAASSYSPNFLEFASHIPDFAQLIDTIIATGALPGALAPRTDDFLTKFTSDIMANVLQLSSVDSWAALSPFVASVVWLGNYGIESGRPKAISPLGFFISVHGANLSCAYGAAIRAAILDNDVYANCLAALRRSV
jgi:hypothetical protein